MNISYVLARQDFFKLGKNGRVSHALGIINGLIGNDIKVSTYTGSNLNEYIDCKLINYIDVNGWGWHFRMLYALFINRRECDFLIIRYATKTSLMYTVFLSLFYRGKWGFEINSLGYHQLSSDSYFLKRIFSHFIKPIEKFTISKAPFLNCVSQSLVDELLPINNNTFCIPNAGYESPFNVDESTENNDINLVYFGMFHNYYSLIHLVEDVISLKQKNVKLHLYGVGEQYDEIRRLVNKYDINNIYLYGRFDLDSIINTSVFKRGCYLVLPYKKGTIADYGSPTKLFEYLSLGLPIISTKLGQPALILSELKRLDCSSVYFYQDSIVEALEQIVMPHKFKGELQKTYFKKNHTWKSRCKVYLEKINDTLES